MIPKLCGADIELGNFLSGVNRSEGTGAEASRAILREVDGVPGPGVNAATHSYWGWGGAGTYNSNYNPQDWGRKYLPANGGCVYIDLMHVEACIPEVISAYDHVAAWHAMLRIVRRAQEAANARLPDGLKIQVLVNNSDGRSNSYGSHLSFLMTRRGWDNLFHRKLHYQLFLAAFQASAIVLTGQGKVGAENGARAVGYQISQRADFFETLCGMQTTFNRPIVNSRDEALCGPSGERANRVPADDMARLHVIFFDNTLCHASSLLKVGMMQIILAMIESGNVNTRLLVEDPVGAVQLWSHDPTLAARASMVSGSALTAVELQLLFLEGARRFVESGACDGIVPRAAEIVALWEDTLLKLEARDYAAVAPRLDWVLKWQLLQRVLEQRSRLSWSAPQLKVLDHLYSSLDPCEGLYWACEASGAVERLVAADRISHFETNPPEDTRAWTRAMLLRRLAVADIEAVDWDSITLRAGYAAHQSLFRKVELANPLGATRALSEPLFQRDGDLDDLLDALGASAPAARSGNQTVQPAYGEYIA